MHKALLTNNNIIQQLMKKEIDYFFEHKLTLGYIIYSE